MEQIWDAIQNIGKWWSRKARESDERLQAKLYEREIRQLELYPNWEDHRG